MSRNRKVARKAAPARRGGGTLMGIFIGLVLGALIVAGAAWYFTRANPFQSSAPGAAAVARPASEGRQGPAALPGKPGGQPVVRQDYEFYSILQEGDNVPPPGAAPPAQRPQVAVPQQQPPAPVQEAAVRPAEQLYLQVGAFESPGQADNLKAQLALAGISASAQRAQLPDGRVMYRVRVGPFSRLEDMNPMRRRLNEAGFASPAVSRASP